MVAGLEVAHIAFGKGAPAGEPRLDDIAGDRTRDGRKQVVGIEIADAGLGLHGEMICRAFGDDIDGAGDSISAIERALRTLEHFFALDFAASTEDRRYWKEVGSDCGIRGVRYL